MTDAAPTLPLAGSWRWAALLAAAMVLPSCDEHPAGQTAGTPPRAGRFGSLRDFVLLERREFANDFALFVDRFEATRGDWSEFANTAMGRAVDAAGIRVGGDPSLPVSGMDLVQARAFAHWRFARLPRRDEWSFAAVPDGLSRFPWGGREDATRTNTSELGFGQVTPVGTFESGRRAGGDQPYDLIGNVSEWTESVPWTWFARSPDLPLDHDELDPQASFRLARKWVLRTPALAVWPLPGGVVPIAWAVEAGGSAVPREVVGADFLSPMAVRTEAVLAGDRRQRTGLRVYATPRELLLALLAPGVESQAQDLEQLRRFVRRNRHRAVLAEVWPAVQAELGGSLSGPVARVLRQELEAASADAPLGR